MRRDAYERVESDLGAIRSLVMHAAPELGERWRCLVDAHLLLTDAMLKNLLAAASGRANPVSDGELDGLRDAHAAALAAIDDRALRTVERSRGRAEGDEQEHPPS
jgi:hypothetical protein